jgi:hypothetical protein
VNRSLSRIIDPDRPGSLTHRFRQSRSEEFRRRFPDLENMSVLDLGGTAISWRVLGPRPKRVTLVNLDDAAAPPEPWIEHIREDACVGGFGKYDLVFSNSLMEHIGGHARRQRFAEVVRESAPSWWVQTPYRYFPIEPHWIFPLFQFLPFAARVSVTRHWRTLHMDATPGRAEAIDLVASIELISATEMRAYWYERLAGVPKSMVAIRN